MQAKIPAILVLLIVTACAPATPTEPDAGPSEAPIDPGLLDPIVPFELAGRLSYNSPFSAQSLEGGPLVPVTEWFNLMVPDPSSTDETALMAVAAIPGTVVVVFPAKAHDGLGVAWGGLDEPWQAAELFKDLKRPFIGAIDAVMNPAGDGVLVAVRERFFPGRIFVIEWKPGVGVVSKSEVLRPSEHRSVWWNDRCQDVRLGVSRAGDVDVFYMQGADQLMRSRRAAGSSDWEFDLVGESPYGRGDLGCFTRVAYDVADRPMVLTMVREWPEYESDPGFPDLDEPPQWNGFDDPPPKGWFGGSAETSIAHGFIGLAQDGVGRWRQDLDDYEPFAAVLHPEYWQLGGADVEEHPDGQVIGGVGVRREELPQVWFEHKGFARAHVPRLKVQFNRLLQPDEFNNTVDQAFQEFARWANVDRVNVTRCGDVHVFGRETQLWPTPEDPYYFGWANDCLYAEQAPVHLTEVFLRSDRFRGMTHAHGRRAFDVAMCVHTASSRPAICAGGWQERFFGRLPPRKVEGAPPALVSASIAEGATDVPVSTSQVTFTLSRPIAVDERVRGQVVRVSDAEREWVDFGSAGETAVGKASLSVALPTLVPGALYRVALLVWKVDGPRLSYLREAAPVVEFRVAGLVRDDDLREVAGLSNCGEVEGERVGDACVVGVRAPYAQGAEFMLPIDYDLEASGGRLPKLYDNASQPVGGVTYEPRWSDLEKRYRLFLKWRTALSPDAAYELRLDPEARNGYGAKFLASDRLWRFRTVAAE